jgi:TolA-binding protein
MSKRRRLGGVALVLAAALAVPGCNLVRGWGRICRALTPRVPRVRLGRRAKPDVVRRYDEAKRLYERGWYPQAAAAFDGWLQEYPDNPLKPSALFYLASAHKKSGSPDAAKGVYERLIQEHPGTKWAAWAQEDVERVNIAEPDLSRYRPRRRWWWPGDWFAPDPPVVRHYKTARKYYDRRRYEQAIAAFRTLAERYPDSPLVPASWYFLARSHEELGEKDEATKAYTHIVTEYRDSDWQKLAQEDLRRLEGK